MARRISGYGRKRIRDWLVPALAVILVVCVILILVVNRKGQQKKAEISENAIEEAVSAKHKMPGETAEVETVEKAITEMPKAVDKPNSRAAGLIDEAISLLDAQPPKVIEARDRLNEILAMPLGSKQRQLVKDKMSELAGRWLFSRRIYIEDKLCGSYKVQSGDLLATIGKRCSVPYQILAKINRLRRPDMLRAGDTIKIINGPFHARVYSSSFTMDLYLQDTFVRSFPVGLGKEGMETPTGLWLVKAGGKLIKPTWTDPITGKTYKAQDPDYPLGSRWIGLEGILGQARGRDGFAIHGTRDPNEIGKPSSQGCIRLHNGDAILFYDILMPGVSQIEVVD